MRAALFLYPLLELWSLIELGAQTSASLAVLWLLSADFWVWRPFALQASSLCRGWGSSSRGRPPAATGRKRHGAGDCRTAAHHPWVDIRRHGDLGIDSPSAALAGQRGVCQLVERRQSRWKLVRSSPHRPGAFHARQTRGDVAQQDDGVTLEGEFQQLDAGAEPLLHQGSDDPDSR